MVKFIHYSGKYPNLCRGDLALSINGKIVTVHNCLTSGGSVSFTPDYREIVTTGQWRVHLPKELEPYREEITALVNANVPHGCCGGCV